MTVELREIARYLRMGRNVPDGALAERIVALRDDAVPVCRPAKIWRRFEIGRGEASRRAVVSGGTRLAIEGTLARHINGCEAVFLACGTIGAGFDAFQRRVAVTSAADALIVQAIGAALIEKTMDAAEDEMRAELADGETLVARYSPGYGDFPLAAQRTILGLLDTPRKIGVSLTDTLLMVPSKSVSAVIGITRTSTTPSSPE